MTVYVVETGCYDQKGISGVFSTRELAEEWITRSGHDLKGDWEKAADITDYVIDEDCNLQPSS